MGTAPRNTLDTKAKYEHYFRQDIDVPIVLYSSTQTKLTKSEELPMATPDLAETHEYIPINLVPSRLEKVQDDSRTLI